MIFAIVCAEHYIVIINYCHTSKIYLFKGNQYIISFFSVKNLNDLQKCEINLKLDIQYEFQFINFSYSLLFTVLLSFSRGVDVFLLSKPKLFQCKQTIG